MNIAWQRNLDQYIGPLMCRLLSGLSWWRGASSVPAKPERILVILLSEMGSLVLMYASGGLLPIRAWPVESFSHVAADLIGRGDSVGIIGMPQYKTLAQVIQAHCGSQACLDLTGYTRTVRELLVLFHLAALLISNDGGPAHVAALTPIATIVFYGPETPTLYGSVGEKSINLYTPLACSPCLTAYNHRQSPCEGKNVCLTSIPPDLVLEKSYALLESRRGLATRMTSGA